MSISRKKPVSCLVMAGKARPGVYFFLCEYNCENVSVHWDDIYYFITAATGIDHHFQCMKTCEKDLPWNLSSQIIDWFRFADIIIVLFYVNKYSAENPAKKYRGFCIK